VFKLNSKKLFFPIAAVISIAVMVFFISYSLSQESYAVSAFTEVGEHTWIVPEGVTSVDVLVVGGGGGGAGRYGGGGGAGGVVYIENYSVSPSQIINITVGDGGNGAPGTGGVGSNGQNSVFDMLTAIGGGGGGGNFNVPGNSGGSGGGSSGSGVGASATQPGSASGGYGNNGGNGLATYWNNGGGGGAGEVGENGTTTKVGDGGDGLYYGDIFGNQYGENGWFGGGGGGGSHNPAPSTWAVGGIGGGGDGGDDLHTLPSGYIGDNGDNGMSGTGGGGGAGSTDSGTGGAGGKGGSGVVLIKYRVKLGTAQAPTMYKGLVGYWSMDASDYNSANSRVTDKSSFENHGINSGATFTTDRFGKEGGAMDFTTSNRILVNNFDLGYNTSFCGWGYATSYPNMMLFSANASPSGPDLYFTSSTIVWNIGDSAANPFKNNGVNVVQQPINEWHYYCVVNNQGMNKAYLYLDGDYYGEAIYRSTSQVDKGFVIGNYHPGSTSYAWRGKIDDFRIYNRLLSESEIQSLYNSYNSKTTTGTLQKGLILDMPLKLKYTKDETPGSEIMTDRTPYSNDGQNYGATISSDGASFDGVNDYVNCGNNDLLMSSSITVSGWVRLLDSSSWMMVNKETGGNPGSYYIYGSSPSAIWSIFGPTSSRYNVSLGTLNLGDWYHLVGTFDSNTRVMKGYRNGALVGTTNNAELGYNSADLLIGRYTSGYYTNGDISNILIYNRALSDDEVKMLYDRGRSDSGIIFTPEN
jgi:hypothetical protein